MSTTNILDLNNRIDALEKIAHNVEPIQQQIDELKAWTDPGTKDASGNPIILTDGSAFNAEGLVVTLEPKQSGSGTPSPENVRPITGYTECVVDRDGLNWWDEEWEIGTINPDTGATEANNNRIRSKNYVPVLGGVTYYFKCPSTSNCRIAYYNANKNYIGGSFDLTPNTTFTTPSNCAYLKFSPNNDYGTTYNNDICINVSDNNINGKYTPYVTPYTATITFGQTVYGGSVDFKTGKVTVTHASIASYNGESINEPWLSSIDEYVSGTTPTTGAQVVYPLATPTELTLTPVELELLKGYNYITTNGDNIDLTYQPDNLKADILLTVSQLYGSKISIFDGILTGGDTGQVLTKTSDDNYDAAWETLPATRTTTKKSEK